MTSIAIIGPGAIGGVLGASLAQNPAFAITLCARTPLDGLRVETPDGVITASPKVLTDPAAATPVDWVLACTKTYDVESTKPWLDRLVGPETRVAVVQNGVEHVALFAHLVAHERIVPVMINLGAVRTAPGQFVQREFGTMIMPASRNGNDLVALFAHTKIAISTSPDFLSQAWIKLLGNCPAIVTALTQRATGPVWNDELASIVQSLVAECAAVARAEGAVIPQGTIERAVSYAQNAPEGSSSSMSVDRLAGRTMELDTRNGIIVRLGRRHGIPTPMNSLLVTLLRASGSPWVAA